MTTLFSATVFANADLTELSARQREGFETRVDLSTGRQWYAEDCAAASEVLVGKTQVFYVEAVCLDYEFIDGGFEMALFSTVEAAQATLGGVDEVDEYCNEVVQVYVTKVA